MRNVQPLYADLNIGGLAVANNGNITNARALREELVERGCIFQSTTDTELFIQLTATSQKAGLKERFIDALRQLEGAYAVVALADGILIGARDPVGIRPLVLGRFDGRPVLASETCALDAIGAQYERDIEPGEMVWCTDDGVESHYMNPKRPKSRPCAFEYVYFARADSFVDGRSVYDARENLGIILAEEHPVEADVVSPVPDTSTPAALGYAKTLGIDFEFGLIKNNYVGRTFIQPTQAVRDLDVSRKHAANKARLEGKRVVLVDDSIVRGTTSRKVVNMVRAAGAREVHMRVASPPIKFPCFYGIDMPSREKLVGAHHSVEEIRDMIGVDSLGYLSIDGLYRALGFEGRDPHAPQLTDHYFTGDYPTRLTDQERKAAIDARELQLTFLAESA
ncbi:MAG: amidophosphoribosyltransferase [Parvularculaceae bacterium]